MGAVGYPGADTFDWGPLWLAGAQTLTTVAGNPADRRDRHSICRYYRLAEHPTERFTISRKPYGGLYWAREGRVGRDLLPEGEARLLSPDSVMAIEAGELSEVRAITVRLAFGGGVNLAERVD